MGIFADKVIIITGVRQESAGRWERNWREDKRR
jgi:hypothetical protein